MENNTVQDSSVSSERNEAYALATLLVRTFPVIPGSIEAFYVGCSPGQEAVRVLLLALRCSSSDWGLVLSSLDVECPINGFVYY